MLLPRSAELSSPNAWIGQPLPKRDVGPSGIAKERKPEVMEALHEAQYEILDDLERGGWCAMACRKTV